MGNADASLQMQAGSSGVPLPLCGLNANGQIVSQASEVRLPPNNQLAVLQQATDVATLNGVPIGSTWVDLSKDVSNFYEWID